MSTKIHHGYRLAEGTDPFAFIAAARTALDPVRDRADARLLGDLVARVLDRSTVKGEDTPDAEQVRKHGPAFTAWTVYEEEQDGLRETDRRKDPNRLELSVGFDVDTGRYGVLLFAESDLLIEAFQALPEVEEYPYWNNTDRPDDLTEAEWDERREFWNRVMPGYTPPAVAMLSWTLRGPYCRPPIALLGDRSPLVLQEFPSIEYRARRVAQEAVIGAAFAALPDDRRRDVSVLTGVVFDAARAPRLPEVAAAAADLLVADVDFDLLLGDRAPAIDDVEAKRARLAEVAASVAADLGRDDD